MHCVPPACCPYFPGCTAWGVYLVRRVYLVPGGCTWFQGVYLAPGGCTWSQEGVPGPRRGVPGHWGKVYLVTGGRCTWSHGGVPGPQGVYLVPEGGPGQVLSPVNRMTDRCKNITLLQTSFAGGNNR